MGITTVKVEITDKNILTTAGNMVSVPLEDIDLLIPNGYYAEIHEVSARITFMSTSGNKWNTAANMWLALRYDTDAPISSRYFKDDKFVASAVLTKAKGFIDATEGELPAWELESEPFFVLDSPKMVEAGGLMLYCASPFEYAGIVGNVTDFNIGGQLTIRFEMKRLTVTASTEIATR